MLKDFALNGNHRMLIAGAIATFGDGCHPMEEANSRLFGFYSKDYAIECLEMARKTGRLTPYGCQIADECMEIFRS